MGKWIKTEHLFGKSGCKNADHNKTVFGCGLQTTKKINGSNTVRVIDKDRKFVIMKVDSSVLYISKPYVPTRGPYVENMGRYPFVFNTE